MESILDTRVQAERSRNVIGVYTTMSVSVRWGISFMGGVIARSPAPALEQSWDEGNRYTDDM